MRTSFRGLARCGAVATAALASLPIAAAFADCDCLPNWYGEYEPAYAPHSALLAFTTSNDASPEHWEWVVGGPDFYYGDMSFGIGHPTWAPDENRIAMTVHDGIAMIRRGDDSNERTLLSGQIGDRDPSWSPAGGWIAFVRGGDIWRMDEDGGSQSQVTMLGGCSAPAISPDGSRVAFEKDGGIWIQGLTPGSTAYAVTEGRRPAWSPNGRWLAFDSTRSGNSEIWVIAFGGSTAVRITSDPGTDLDPTWSGDGTTIAYTHEVPNCSCIRTEQTLPDYTVGVESKTWGSVKGLYR